ncbi:Ent-kaurene oxidase [Leucoagaricus sp. SymC.cos]|nr:Ent-kaurene oxidase [Leucoagaricus sp. SymC.cos]
MAVLNWIVRSLDDHPFIATLLCALLCLYAYNESKKPDLRHIPILGHSNTVLSFLDIYKYRTNATAYVQQGYEQFKDSAFRIPNFRRWVVFLNGSKYLEELRKVPEEVLSSRAVVIEALQAGIILGPNFAENHYHMAIIRNQMTRKIPEFLTEIFDEVGKSFKKYLPVKQEWTPYNPNDVIVHIVSRSVNRICVGADHCRDEDLVEASLVASPHLNISSIIISLFPEFLQPCVIVHLISFPHIHIRSIFIDIHCQVDALTWLMDEADASEQSNENLALRLLLINNGALSTTTLISVHFLYHLASELHYLPLLRQEIADAVADEGWSKKGLDKMHRLDSFIKETMRMHSISVGLVGHKALQDYTFADGTFIPKGTIILTPANSIHYDESNYTDAHEFKGFRFIEGNSSEDEKGARHSFVSLTPTYLPFGYGNHACPGRFFAAAMMKLILAHLLVHYDLMLEGGGDKRPEDFFLGGLRMPNKNARLLFRQRQP